jgi:hypothetical protein
MSSSHRVGANKQSEPMIIRRCGDLYYRRMVDFEIRMQPLLAWLDRLRLRLLHSAFSRWYINYLGSLDADEERRRLQSLMRRCFLAWKRRIATCHAFVALLDAMLVTRLLSTRFTHWKRVSQLLVDEVRLARARKLHLARVLKRSFREWRRAARRRVYYRKILVQSCVQVLVVFSGRPCAAADLFGLGIVSGVQTEASAVHWRLVVTRRAPCPVSSH